MPWKLARQSEKEYLQRWLDSIPGMGSFYKEEYYKWKKIREELERQLDFGF